jgi:predicted AAA+ superfamily ATPase
MIKRHLANQVHRLLEGYPAVGLLGARQTGKTTLAKTFSTAYYDLELEQERLWLDLQWEAVVKAKGPIILDEAQHVPEIFPRIRSAIDMIVADVRGALEELPS